jgi:uncharacterized protein (TIGR03000 family)
MMNRRRLGALALALAAAVILIWPSVGSAQLFGRGLRGGRAYYYDPDYPSGWSWGYGRGYYYSSGPGWYDSGYYYPRTVFRGRGYRYQSAYPADGTSMMQADSAGPVLTTVRLPDANANLWIEGQEMGTGGIARRFVSPSLAPGRYSYTFRASWSENGKNMDETRQVKVAPGDRIVVDFTAPEKGPAGSRRESGYGPDQGTPKPRTQEDATKPRPKPSTPPPATDRPGDNPPEREE